MSTGKQLSLSGSTNTSRQTIAVENHFLSANKIIYAMPKRTYLSMDITYYMLNSHAVGTDLTLWRYLLDDIKASRNYRI